MTDHDLTDREIASLLLEYFHAGRFTIKQICASTGLMFHQVNAIMRDGELVRIEDEQKEKLIKLLYGNS
jgi:hypothetical protein